MTTGGAFEKKKTLERAHWFSEDLATNETESLRKAAIDLLEKVYEHSVPTRKHPQRHLPQVEQLILNLLLTNTYHEGYIAIEKASGAYSAKGIVTYRVLIKLLVASLKEMGWLHEYPGYWQGLVGMSTRYGLLEQLSVWIEASGLDPANVHYTTPKDQVVLKDLKKRRIQIPKEWESKVSEMENNVRQINKRLEHTFIDLVLTDQELEEINEDLRGKSSLDGGRESRLVLSKKYLRRIFNNGSLEQGGRFYGGWWQNLPSLWRPFIVINNWFTEELDFSGMHIEMMYSMINEERPRHSQDLYQIEGVEPEFRDVTKKMFVILVNAGTRKKALAGITRNSEIKELRQDRFPTGIKNFDQYLNRIEEFHSPIQHFFGTGYGVKLQNLDSQIAERVMLRMDTEHGAACLPVHDSFICADEHVSALERLMHEEYEKLMGSHCSITFKSHGLSVPDSEERQKVIDYMYEMQDGYPARYDEWMRKHDWRSINKGANPLSERPIRLKSFKESF